MKKFLFLIALVCAVVNVSAQDSKWSVKAGIGLSTITGSDTEGSKSALSYKVGVGYEFGLSDCFSIEPALMFSNKAYEEEGIDGTINRFYLELPVLAAYKIALGSDTKLLINAGPYVAYGVLGNDVEYYGSYSVNAFDVFERFDAGAQIGAKVNFGYWEIGAEYSRAFTKCIDGAKAYNQGFGVTFGYSF